MGLSLHVVEAGQPGNPVLLLLHGFPEFWWALRNQITPARRGEISATARTGAADERATSGLWAKQALEHPTQALRSTYVAFLQLPWVPEAKLGSFDFAGLKMMMQGSAKASMFEPGALDRYAEAWADAGSLTAMLNYYRARRGRDNEGEPARLTTPTLILWAGKDLFLERNVAEAGLALCDRQVGVCGRCKSLAAHRAARTHQCSDHRVAGN